MGGARLCRGGGALCIKSMDHPEANAALGNSSGSIKTISAGLAECACARKHTREGFVCTHTLDGV